MTHRARSRRRVRSREKPDLHANGGERAGRGETGPPLPGNGLCWAHGVATDGGRRSAPRRTRARRLRRRRRSAPPKPTPTPARSAKQPKRAPRTDPAAIAARAHVPVLCYHQIRPETGADGAAALPYIVSPKVFAAQMTALDRRRLHHHRPATRSSPTSRAARSCRASRSCSPSTTPRRASTRTSCRVLERHKMTATFFVMTVVLGKPGWLTRGQVRALDRAGMTIGAHTWDHKDVTTYAGDDYKTQLNEPKRELEKLVGHRVGSSPTRSASGGARRSRTWGSPASTPPSSSPTSSTATTRCGRSAGSSSPSSTAPSCCARSASDF